MSEEDGGMQKDLKAIQMIQNKMVRVLNNVKLTDKQSTKSLFKKVNMLSVNQTNAQIKLTELWKAVHNENCPINITKMKDVLPERALRSKLESGKILMEAGVSEMSKRTFVNDGIKLWNKCPNEIKNSKSLFSAKREIKKFVANLPI